MTQHPSLGEVQKTRRSPDKLILCADPTCETHQIALPEFICLQMKFTFNHVYPFYNGFALDNNVYGTPIFLGVHSVLSPCEFY